MNGKIILTIEKIQDADTNQEYITIALTGDTYSAKDIIKGMGDYHFSNQVSYGKAWRSQTWLGSEALTTCKNEVVELVNRTKETLSKSGYSLVRG